jgi:CheY-like chemotaxis protein
MGPPRILIVAGDPDVGDLYSLELATSLESSTTWVPDAASARRLLGSDAQYDAILLDVGSPPRWRDCTDLGSCAGGLPVIVVSGWIAADRRFRRQAFEAGCAAFVAKPCSSTSLSEAVRRARLGERYIELVAVVPDLST